MANVNFAFCPKDDKEFHCYSCNRKVDIHENSYKKTMFLSVGVRDVNRDQVEIQYLCAEFPIPVCDTCKNVNDRISKYSYLLFAVVCVVYPYFVLPTDLDTLGMIISYILIALISWYFGRFLPGLLVLLLKKMMNVKEDGSYPILSEMFSSRWCENAPSEQVMPGMHLAVPADGDYEEYFKYLVDNLNDLAERNNYTLIINNFKTQSCVCKKGALNI